MFISQFSYDIIETLLEGLRYVCDATSVLLEHYLIVSINNKYLYNKNTFKKKKKLQCIQYTKLLHIKINNQHIINK